jgi:hypothetical protein
VAAWIYAVINPIIDGLEREQGFLQSGNLTWRYYSQRCEYILPIRGYLEGNQGPNYSDFLAENPSCRESFRVYDESVEAVNNSASAIYGWLLSGDQLAQGLAVSLNEYEARRTSGPRLADMRYEQADLPKFAAEYLINNIQSLPSHYLLWRFWEIASGSLLPLRELNNFDPLRRSVQVLRQQSQAVKKDLEDLRLEFSRVYDLPAAPIPEYPPKP